MCKCINDVDYFSCEFKMKSKQTFVNHASEPNLLCLGNSSSELVCGDKYTRLSKLTMATFHKGEYFSSL